MMAWAAAGVALPHSSGAQMGSGTPVSQSQLAPGDLVFYYSPVSHVGIYIGNGQIVHAANPSTGVQVAPVNIDAVLRCRPTWLSRATRSKVTRPAAPRGGRPALCCAPSRQVWPTGS